MASAWPSRLFSSLSSTALTRPPLKTRNSPALRIQLMGAFKRFRTKQTSCLQLPYPVTSWWLSTRPCIATAVYTGLESVRLWEHSLSRSTFFTSWSSSSSGWSSKATTTSSYSTLGMLQISCHSCNRSVLILGLRSVEVSWQPMHRLMSLVQSLW